MVLRIYIHLSQKYLISYIFKKSPILCLKIVEIVGDLYKDKFFF